MGSVSKEYMDVTLVLMAKQYEKDMFKNRFNTGGNLIIKIYMKNLENLPKKILYF